MEVEKGSESGPWALVPRSEPCCAWLLLSRRHTISVAALLVLNESGRYLPSTASSLQGSDSWLISISLSMAGAASDSHRGEVSV